MATRAFVEQGAAPQAVIDRPAKSLANDSQLGWAAAHPVIALAEYAGDPQPLEFAIAAIAQQPLHCLFAGPDGSGRTALAKLVARGVLCTSHVGAGCGTCDTCRGVDGDHLPQFVHLECHFRGSKAHISFVLDQLFGTAGIDQVVLFLEGLDQLEPSAAAHLAERIPMLPGNVSLVATAENCAALPAQLRLQFRTQATARPSPEVLRSLIDRVAGIEGVSLGDGAAAMIAAISCGYRDAIDRLEHVACASPIGAVDRRAVIDHLLDGLPDRLAAYLNALASGDLKWQLAELAAMRGTPAEKLEALRLTLLHLKHAYVGPHILLRPSSHDALLPDPEQCSDILAAFEARREHIGITLAQLTDQLLLFWGEQAVPNSAAALEIMATRCHEMLEGLRLHAPFHSAWQPSIMRTLLSEQTTRLIEAGGPRINRSMPPRAEKEYLDKTQAQDIYEAATFQLQEFGRPFNLCISINHHALNQESDKECSHFARSLGHAMSKTLSAKMTRAGWEGELVFPPFNRICFHERGEAGVYSTLIGAVSPSLFEFAQDWLRHTYLPRLVSGQLSRRAIAFDAHDNGQGQAGIKRHWMLTRRLWRGVDPSFHAKGTPLLDLLGVPAMDRHPSGVFLGRRYNSSRGIAPMAQQTARDDQLGHLSAMEDRAWDWMFSGWEIEEYRCRQDERRARAKQRVEIIEAAAGNAEQEAKLLAQMRAEYAVDPRDRPRSWEGWWHAMRARAAARANN